MSAEKELVRTFWKYFEDNDLDGCVSCIAPGTTITFDGQDQDINGYRTVGEMFRNAFPDMKVEVLNQVQEGDQVVTYARYAGTQTGELMGIPPTGRKVDTTGVDLDTIRDGKIIRRIDISNRLEMLQQLGVMPAPEAAPA